MMKVTRVMKMVKVTRETTKMLAENMGMEKARVQGMPKRTLGVKNKGSKRSTSTNYMLEEEN